MGFFCCFGVKSMDLFSLEYIFYSSFFYGLETVEVLRGFSSPRFPIILSPLGGGKWSLVIPPNVGIDIGAVLSLFPDRGEWTHNLLPTFGWGPSKFVSRAHLNEQCNLHKEALKDYSRAIALDPLYTQAWYYRGNLAFNLGRDKVAEDHLSRAIALYYLWEEKVGKGLKPLLIHKAHYERALVRLVLGDKPGAVLDLKVTAKSNQTLLASEAFKALVKIYLHQS